MRLEESTKWYCDPEKYSCEWKHTILDGVNSWWESSCGVSGDKPYVGWKYCPFCGKRLVISTMYKGR